MPKDLGLGVDEKDGALLSRAGTGSVRARTKPPSVKIYADVGGNLSSVRTGNPWSVRGRGAVKWGPDDFMLWDHGVCVNKDLPRGKSASFKEAQARAFIETGKVPE